MIDAIYDTADDCLAAVRATARLLEDPRWANKQDAAGLAVLVSALSDRALRMLGGLRPLESGDDGQDAIEGDGATPERPQLGPGQRDDSPAD
jgi:hypothetical protein